MSAADKKPVEFQYQTSHYVDLSILPDEKFEVQLRSATQILSKWIFDTREKAIRESLIKLGWTPPPKV